MIDLTQVIGVTQPGHQSSNLINIQQNINLNVPTQEVLKRCKNLDPKSDLQDENGSIFPNLNLENPANQSSQKCSNNNGFQNKLIITPPKNTQQKYQDSGSSGNSITAFKSPSKIPSVSPILKLFATNEKTLSNSDQQQLQCSGFVQDFTKLLQLQEDGAHSANRGSQLQNPILDEEIQKSIRNLNLDDDDEDADYRTKNDKRQARTDINYKQRQMISYGQGQPTGWGDAQNLGGSDLKNNLFFQLINHPRQAQEAGVPEDKCPKLQKQHSKSIGDLASIAKNSQFVQA